MRDPSLGDLQSGISRLKRDEPWTSPAFLSFLAAGEVFFEGWRGKDELGPARFAGGMRALDRTALLVLSSFPNVKAAILQLADTRIDRFFDHLKDDDAGLDHFEISAISRGEGCSPASVCGRLLAMGLVRLSDPVLDPVLDRAAADGVCDVIARPTRNILEAWASGLLDLGLSRACAQRVLAIQRRLWADQSNLPAIEEAAGGLRDVMRQVGRRADGLQPVALAAETSLHLSRSGVRDLV